MTAMSYRPTEERLNRLRAAAAERGTSVQALLDTAVDAYLDEREADVRAISQSLLQRNGKAYARLAHL